VAIIRDRTIPRHLATKEALFETFSVDRGLHNLPD
jgi:hypothetical protein